MIPVRVYRLENLASVHVLALEEAGPADTDPARLVEAVESVQPPIPWEEKWVFILSTWAGCPVRCAMCDAGSDRSRALTADQILDQARYLLRTRVPAGAPPQRKLKVQFARMGEPALNPAVIDALRRLPDVLPCPGLLPSVSTIAPRGRDAFFQALRDVKDEHYPNGAFQLQFSVHTTSNEARRALIPVPTWDLRRMASFGASFRRSGDRKVTLNFAPVAGFPVDPAVLAGTFDPTHFLVKITPVNPTAHARAGGLLSMVAGEDPESARPLVEAFRAAGFETLLSIGELDENLVGSNCGQFVTDPGGRGVRDGYVCERYEVGPERPVGG